MAKNSAAHFPAGEDSAAHFSAEMDHTPEAGRASVSTLLPWLLRALHPPRLPLAMHRELPGLLFAPPLPSAFSEHAVLVWFEFDACGDRLLAWHDLPCSAPPLARRPSSERVHLHLLGEQLLPQPGELPLPAVLGEQLLPQPGELPLPAVLGERHLPGAAPRCLTIASRRRRRPWLSRPSDRPRTHRWSTWEVGSVHPGGRRRSAKGSCARGPRRRLGPDGGSWLAGWLGEGGHETTGQSRKVRTRDQYRV